ncbi:uncharacterized protein N0V89_003673 [Didymosphaeria variabile]|uniref:Uncharacterized protein n=1 Tax=Didymosphaeria variabile TaxID=1932322 RepID=A0A9W8XQQ8_9PLEO|nr:uncharacterized protein N0V89_003673 [Didymosphaeria variabile]KAJ4355653.1 hypothetical protein N0V89_003673 [Didymosphaeria variabile]
MTESSMKHKAMPESRKGPYTLVTVNTAPDRAKKLIGRMIEGLQDRYDITHVDNCTAIDQVAAKVRQHQPNILFSASMWSPEEAGKIRAIAERERPGQWLSSEMDQIHRF